MTGSMTGEQPYPVRLDADLDEPLHRWLWLVKWLLVIPHLLVLAVLWFVVVVLTLVAGVCIVATGRYPRQIFDLVVGVLRWTWRVQCYAFVLSTDRYPPFTLGDVPDYPAHLAVEYPEEGLSRGLVLVKWWLLAIPHYLIVGLFGGIATGVTGLIGVMVLVAAVALAFTGRYLPTLYDLVLGMERWTFRVIAYAGLLRDEYPPFRLDQGGTDPGSQPSGGRPGGPAVPEGA
jgi:hypothetical protein